MPTVIKNLIRQSVINSLNSSGFPFQTAVEDVIAHADDCGVQWSEYLWRDRDGKDQFLDLVAIAGKFVLAIECKKTKQDVGWTFLQPTHEKKLVETGEFRCLNVDNKYFPQAKF